MPQYYIKDLADAYSPNMGLCSTHKQDLKKERDRLNREFSDPNPRKRFVIGEMK